jgi:RHS repeat-associated protein
VKISTATKSQISFRGVLRTSRGSLILTAIENLPIAPTGALTVATNCHYSQPAEPQERGAGVGQSIYIGQMYDAATSLDYLNARYYNGSQGQFISEDPMFWGVPSRQNISDPQSLNAYSYSGDNPIIKSDPTGKFVFLPALIAIGVGLVLPQSAGGDTDANGNLVPVGGMNSAEIYGTTAVVAGGGQFQLLSTMAKTFAFQQIAAAGVGVGLVTYGMENIHDFFTLNGNPLSDDGSVTNATEIKKIKVTPPQPLQWTSGSPVITSAHSAGEAQGGSSGGGGGTGTGGGVSSGTSGGNPRYVFNAGKNLYNQTIQDVFPGYAGKVGSK